MSTLGRVASIISCVAALAAVAIGWRITSELETRLNASSVDVGESLVAAEAALRQSGDVALASAASLDAAAQALAAVESTTDASAESATDLSLVAGSLDPTLVSIANALDSLDSGIDRINRTLDALPFSVGSFDDFDAELDNIDQLRSDLRESQASLAQLGDVFQELGPESAEVAKQLDVVADELRSSETEVLALADALNRSLSELRNDEAAPIDLGILKGLFVVLGVAILGVNVALWSRAPDDA